MSAALRERLAAAAPDWPAALLDAVAAEGAAMSAPDGARLFAPGDPCANFLVVLRGAVRVSHVNESGRTMTLYRVGPGESCVVTTSCLLAGRDYQAWGHAEGAVEAAALPASRFLALMDGSAPFRALALRVFAARMVELVEAIDELLAGRVDLRLASFLAERAPLVPLTHQAMAEELGSAREVVSRLLKEFERRGWVALERGAVRVRRPDALRAHASGGAE